MSVPWHPQAPVHTFAPGTVVHVKPCAGAMIPATKARASGRAAILLGQRVVWLAYAPVLCGDRHLRQVPTASLQVVRIQYDKGVFADFRNARPLSSAEHGSHVSQHCSGCTHNSGHVLARGLKPAPLYRRSIGPETTHV